MEWKDKSGLTFTLTCLKTKVAEKNALVKWAEKFPEIPFWLFIVHEETIRKLCTSESAAIRLTF